MKVPPLSDHAYLSFGRLLVLIYNPLFPPYTNVCAYIHWHFSFGKTDELGGKKSFIWEGKLFGWKCFLPVGGP